MRSSTWWMIGGILCLIGGFAALLNPMAGTLAATAIAGWSFLLVGVIQIIAAFSVPGGWNKAMLALFGVLGVLVGITIFKNPLASALTLTMAVAILILVSGVVRFFIARDLKGTSAYAWVVVSAVLSLLLGVMILADFPASAVTILGILLGVELIFNGVALIGLSGAAKKVDEVVGANV